MKMYLALPSLSILFCTISLEKQALEWKGFEASGTILLHPNADLLLKSWSVVEIVIASSGTPVICTTTDVLSSSSSSFSFFFFPFG
ncbi:hypothetical protein SCA6_002110 [Theobroma cacao]